MKKPYLIFTDPLKNTDHDNPKQDVNGWIEQQEDQVQTCMIPFLIVEDTHRSDPLELWKDHKTEDDKSNFVPKRHLFTIIQKCFHDKLSPLSAGIKVA